VKDQIPDDLYYTREHYWIRPEGDLATIGLTDYAQNELGDIVYLELPETDAEYHAADQIGTIESVKTTTELYAPVSGLVVEANDRLPASPELVNNDPYGQGWLAVFRLSDPSEIEELLSAADYGNVVEEGE
jgi:glycine cleavage system H protein